MDKKRVCPDCDGETIDGDCPVCLRNALEYMMQVREIKCVSPQCEEGNDDDSCAYHKAIRALRYSPDEEHRLNDGIVSGSRLEIDEEEVDAFFEEKLPFRGAFCPYCLTMMRIVTYECSEDNKKYVTFHCDCDEFEMMEQELNLLLLDDGSV